MYVRYDDGKRQTTTPFVPSLFVPHSYCTVTRISIEVVGESMEGLVVRDTRKKKTPNKNDSVAALTRGSGGDGREPDESWNNKSRQHDTTTSCHLMVHSNIILKPIRQATSRQQQLEALECLDLNNYDDDLLLLKSSGGGEDEQQPLPRRQVALGLIQTIPVVGNDMQDALLDAVERVCGGGEDDASFLILSAVLQTLREIAAATSVQLSSSSSLLLPRSFSSATALPSSLVGGTSTSTIKDDKVRANGLQQVEQEQSSSVVNNNMASTALSTALAALYRIACTFPTNKNHHHHSNGAQQTPAPRQTSLWNFVSKTHQEDTMDSSHWIGQLLLVPQLAANAAAAAAAAAATAAASVNSVATCSLMLAGSQRLLLPPWLTPPSRYYCRLVECACRCHNFYHCNLFQNQNHDPAESHSSSHHPSSPRFSLLPALIQLMMRRGHVLYVARGFYQFLRHHDGNDKNCSSNSSSSKKKNPKGGGETEGTASTYENAPAGASKVTKILVNSSSSSIMKSKAGMLGASLVAAADGDRNDSNININNCGTGARKTSSHAASLLLLSPRQVALLYQALLKLALTRENMQSTTTTNGNNNCDGEEDGDEKTTTTTTTIAATVATVFRPALERGGPDVQEAVIRQVVLSSSSLFCGQQDMAYQNPKRVGDHVVSLLLSLSNNSNSSENDDSDDDDDDEKNARSPHQALVRQLNDVSLVWSQPAAFVQNADPQRQHYVSCFLCSALEALQNNEKDGATSMAVDWESQDFMSTILHGVTIRLESTHADSIRRDGMRVGEALARLLGQELQFDELNDERTTVVADTTTYAEHQDQHLDNRQDKGQDREHDSRQRTKRMKRRQRARQARLMDPDAAYVSSEDEQDVESGDEESEESETSEEASLEDSVWSDNEDDELLPYDLHDDLEDLRETPKPLYLKDCLDLLQTPETNEHAASRHETALQALPSLVRSSPMDVVDIAPSLALQVLRMENKYGLETFDEYIAFSLTALLVEQSQSVGHALITTFFKGDVCLMDRLKILTALNQSAYELSGFKDLEEHHRQQQQQQHDRANQQPRVSGKRNLVASTSLLGTDVDATLSTAVENALDSAGENTTTRRWGKSRQQRQQRPIMVNNKFSRIGPMWFVMLIQGFLECKEDAKIWGGANGATLLARFFLTLATLTEFAGLGTEFHHAPGSNTSMACHLLNLVVGFLCADVAQVRTAALCAVSTSLALMRSDQLLRLLFSNNAPNDDTERNNLPMMLSRIAQSDPDVDCRRLAQTISGQMVRSIQDSSMSASSLPYY